MVSFQIIAVTIVAALTTSVISAPIPGVYIGAAHVGEKLSDTSSVLPRALVPRTPVYLESTRVGTSPEYGGRKREVDAHHLTNTVAVILSLQEAAAKVMPLLSE